PRHRGLAAGTCSACRRLRQASCPRPPSRTDPRRRPARRRRRAARCRSSRGLRAGSGWTRSSGVLLVLVVPPPPLVWLRLWMALGRVLPGLLAAERRPVEEAPDRSDGLEPPPAGEIGPVDLVAVAKKGVQAEHLAVLILAPLGLRRREAEVDAVRPAAPG